MQAAGRSAGGHIKPGPVCSPKRRKVYNRGHERRTVRVALNPLRTAPSGSVEAEVEDKPFLKDALLDAALPLTRKHINFFKFGEGCHFRALSIRVEQHGADAALPENLQFGTVTVATFDLALSFPLMSTAVVA
jgi:hypothetical protein